MNMSTWVYLVALAAFAVFVVVFFILDIRDAWRR